MTFNWKTSLPFTLMVVVPSSVSSFIGHHPFTVLAWNKSISSSSSAFIIAKFAFFASFFGRGNFPRSSSKLPNRQNKLVKLFNIFKMIRLIAVKWFQSKRLWLYKILASFISLIFILKWICNKPKPLWISYITRSKVL